MKPSLVVVGFVLGSAAAITFALLGVAVVFTWLQPAHPRLESEIPSLWGSLALFAVLTALAGASFYGLVRDKPWRRAAVGLLVLGIAAVAWYHWPS